jgi:hypothetical protein
MAPLAYPLARPVSAALRHNQSVTQPLKLHLRLWSAWPGEGGAIAHAPPSPPGAKLSQGI